MKAALAILVLWGLFSLAHSQERIIVRGLAPTEFDSKFDIIGSKTYDKITLDCHSFIHGVSFYQKNHLEKHFYLEIDECSDLYTLLRDRSEQEILSCLRLEDSPRSIGVTDDLADCH